MKRVSFILMITTTFSSVMSQSKLHSTIMKANEHHAIITAIQNIFDGADQHDWRKVEESLTPFVMLDYTSLAGGSPAKLEASEITEAWRNVLPGFQSTHHQIGGFLIRRHTPNEASVTFHGLAVHYLPSNDGASYWTVVGTYDYHLILDGQAWKADQIKFNLQKQHGNLDLPVKAQANVKDGVRFEKATATKAAREVVAAFFSALESLDIDAFLEVWYKNGKQIMPLAPEGFPQILDGKEEIYHQYKGLPDNFSTMSFPYKIYDTEDPDKVIVQYTGYIPLKDGGEYNNNYVGVFAVHEGKLMTFIEYFDPFILEEAFGTKLQTNFNVER
jgi:ketosteroid isomerase-like protein